MVLFIEYFTFCFFILSEFISSSFVFAAQFFVPDDYDTIQDAINASSTGDTVSVAAGTYYENILFPGNKTNITLISENGPELTVIDGDYNGSVVTFAAGNNATLDGFTITNGLTSGNGGGISIGNSSSPTIANCIITDNEAFAGGGINCGKSSTPFITDSIIQYNSVTGDNPMSNGGGIHIQPAASPTINNCIIENNTSDRNGGGIAFNSAEPWIVNCTFDNNTAGFNGGGMAFNSSEPWIFNCTFYNNTAVFNGGAISFKNSAPIITNCSFSNNSALTKPGGAICCNNPSPKTRITNSIFWGDYPAEITCEANIISVTYSNIQGGPIWPKNFHMFGETTWPGTGNINADPRFLDQANGDFHLMNDSPCIDAGDNSDPYLPPTDIDGDDRIIDDPAVADTGNSNGESAIVDMGAFEKYLNVESPPPSSSGGGGSGGGGGGGNGIFGDIVKSSVIGYHLDGLTTEGVQIYMPVTQGFKALKGAQEYVRSFAPNLARIVRECFDFLERKADADKEGFLYNLGTNVFPVLGKIAEASLELIGEEHFINAAYSNTTISVEEFNKLKKQGLAIAPKVVKDMERPKQEQNITDLILVY